MALEIKPAAALREAVEAALQSREFSRSTSLAGLLRFMMQAQEDGDAPQVSETCIARRHFLRGPEFDPALDSIVRVSVNRLRDKLETFAYANRSCEHVATLPPGEYRLRLAANPFYLSQDLPAAAPETAGQAATAAEERPAASELSFDRPLPLPAPRDRTPWWTIAAAACFLLVVAGLTGWHLLRKSLYDTPWTVASVSSFSRAAGMKQFPSISPDGEAVVFAWNQSSQQRSTLYTQAFGSTTPAPLPGSTEGDSRPSFSPDGRSLAFVRERPTQGLKDVLVRDLATGHDRVLASLDGYAPWVCRLPKLSWSPDSQTIYTVAATVIDPRQPNLGGQQSCNVARIHVASGRLDWLTHALPTTFGDLEASVSPDGKQVAFLRREAYAHDRLLVMPAAGGTPHAIGTATHDTSGLAWSADGKFLFLCEVDATGGSRIEEVPLDGGPSTTLAEGLESFGYPALSANGRRLLVSRYSVREDVLLYRNGQNSVLVSDGNRNTNGVLSPDGRTLAFASQRFGLMTIWLQDIAGKTPRRITEEKTAANWPSWNDDGSALLYECRRETYSQVCEYLPATSRSRTLTSGPFDHMLPSFSHDGKHFYYIAGPSGSNELYRDALDGGAKLQITHGGALAGHESVDGRSLYILTNQQGPGFLAVPVTMSDIDTSPGHHNAQPFVISELPYLGPLHPWTPAPGGIVYMSFAADHTDVFLFHLQTRATTLLFRVPGATPVEVLRVAADGAIVYSPQAQRRADIEQIDLRLQRS